MTHTTTYETDRCLRTSDESRKKMREAIIDFIEALAYENEYDDVETTRWGRRAGGDYDVAEIICYRHADDRMRRFLVHYYGTVVMYRNRSETREEMPLAHLVPVF